jgi:hypothetical protein
MAEYLAVNERVLGSSPSRGALFLVLGRRNASEGNSRAKPPNRDPDAKFRWGWPPLEAPEWATMKRPSCVCRAAGSARHPVKVEVEGSNPFRCASAIFSAMITYLEEVAVF